MPSGGKFSSRNASRGKSRSVAGGKTRKRYGKKRSKTRRRRGIRGGLVIV
jgi:hypothetical protein